MICLFDAEVDKREIGALKTEVERLRNSSASCAETEEK